MKTFLLSLLFCASLCAQSPYLVVHTANGDTPLSSSYSFPDTPAYSAAAVTLRINNPGTAPVEIVTVTSSDPNFTVTGAAIDEIVAPSANSGVFYLNFAPQAAGRPSGILQVTYLAQQSDGTYGGTPSTINLAVSGNALTPTLVLSYGGSSGNVNLQADSPTALNFGTTLVGSSSIVNFTLSNQTSAPIATPDITLQSGIFSNNAFKLNQPAVLSIPPQSSASFSVIFAPTTDGVTSTSTLQVGSNFYSLIGTGYLPHYDSSVNSLQIVPNNQAGAVVAIQGGVIDFGQSAQKTSITIRAFNNDPNNGLPVTVPNVSVTGAGFAISTTTTFPYTVPFGGTLQFDVVFSPPGTGTYSGTLSIGSRQFSLTAKGASSAIPAVTFQVDQSPLMNQQQAHLSLQFASPAPAQLLPTLTMQFTPLVTGITDDPAIKFLANNGRQLQITFASGSQSGTFNGQSALTFQTGTTAGTIQFTLAFADGTTATKSFTIPFSAVQITSAQAVRQAPNLVLNLTGYDNTYSVGNLVFKFYDTKGKLLTPNGISIEAGSSFHQFFFDSTNQTGGAFTLQAKFPVTGDVTTVGSVAVAIANSVQATNLDANFQ